MSEQKVYFDNGTTQVTVSMVKDGPNSYPIHNINSIKLQSEELPWVKSALNAFFGITFFGFYFDRSVVKYVRRRDLTLSTSSGEVRAFVSTEPHGPRQISDAINQSLSDRASRVA